MVELTYQDMKQLLQIESKYTHTHTHTHKTHSMNKLIFATYIKELMSWFYFKILQIKKKKTNLKDIGKGTMIKNRHSKQK